MYTYTGTATKRQHYWRHVKAIQNQSKQRVANGSKAREIIVDECTLSKRKNIDATKEKQHRIGPSTKKQRLTFIQWPFQEPKLEVPTTYKAYFLRPIGIPIDLSGRFKKAWLVLTSDTGSSREIPDV